MTGQTSAGASVPALLLSTEKVTASHRSRDAYVLCASIGAVAAREMGPGARCEMSPNTSLRDVATWKGHGADIAVWARGE